MKHLKIYEAFNTNNSLFSIKIATNLLNLIGCTIEDLYPEYIIYDYDYDNDYSDEDNDISEEEHEKMVNNLDRNKYWTDIIPHIQKWFDTDEHKDNLTDSLPFVKNVIFLKIEPYNGELYLDMKIDVNPKEMIIFLLRLMDDSSFITDTDAEFRSVLGFHSLMPCTEKDIINILERSDYNQLWKLLVIVADYHLSEFKADDYSLPDYIREKMSPSLYDFQK